MKDYQARAIMATMMYINQPTKGFLVHLELAEHFLKTSKEYKLLKEKKS